MLKKSSFRSVLSSLGLMVALAGCLASPADLADTDEASEIGGAEAEIGNFRNQANCPPRVQGQQQSEIQRARERLLNAAVEAANDVNEAKRRCEIEAANRAGAGILSCLSARKHIVDCQETWRRWGEAARATCGASFGGDSARRLADARAQQIARMACDTARHAADALSRCRGQGPLMSYNLRGASFAAGSGVTCEAGESFSIQDDYNQGWAFMVLDEMGFPAEPQF